MSYAISNSNSDLTFRNPISLSGSWLHVVLPNVHPDPVSFVANASDAELLAPHRWRYLNGRVVTLIESGSTYTIWPVENIILRRQSPHDSIPHKNGDSLDIRRVNLDPPAVRASQRPSHITVHGQVCHIHLSGSVVAVIDRDDYTKVHGFKWLLISKPRASGESANYVQASLPLDEGGRKAVTLLQRHVLGLKPGDKERVYHVNGDRLDFRKSNLTTEKPHD